jgi:hemoglobin-like flavoprotein
MPTSAEYQPTFAGPAMQTASIRMTPRQVALVQESFAKIVPMRGQAAMFFYDRLFALDPSTRPLFRGDMKSQGAKLMAAIGAVVKSLERIDTILDDLWTLARRHHRYGVREEHYASVGAALLWTLEQGLGFDFTPDVRRAWATAYDLLSGAMIAVSSDKDATIPRVGLQVDCQHPAGPELLRDRLTAPK